MVLIHPVLRSPSVSGMADYYDCARVRIRGGGAVAASHQPVFRAGGSTPHLTAYADWCLSAIDRLDQTKSFKPMKKMKASRPPILCPMLSLFPPALLPSQRRPGSRPPLMTARLAATFQVPNPGAKKLTATTCIAMLHRQRPLCMRRSLFLFDFLSRGPSTAARVCQWHPAQPLPFLVLGLSPGVEVGGRRKVGETMRSTSGVEALGVNDPLSVPLALVKRQAEGVWRGEEQELLRPATA